MMPGRSLPAAPRRYRTAPLPRQGLGRRLGHCQPEKLDDGSVLWHGLISDITQRKQDDELVRHLAQHDKLTGLANRALFMDRLKQQVTRARRDSSHLALVFLDLNKFKPVNDTFGHAVGDLLLPWWLQKRSGTA